MTNSAQAEFIQSLDGELTAEQAAQLLEMGLEGDTGADALETGGEPDASTVQAGGEQDGEAGNNESEGAAEAGAGSEPELTSENAVILAKDGKHTINYDKLVDERKGRKAAELKAQQEADARQEAELRAQEAERKLAELQAQAQERADAGQAPTAVDDQVAVAQAAIAAGADPSLFGDFSEEALAKGIDAVVEMRVESRLKAELEPIKALLAPLQQREQIAVTESHYGAIYAKHPDADSIAESAELDAWINAQPSFVRDGFRGVLEKGTADQVVELFDSFKQATGLTQAAAQPDPNSVKAATKAVIANTKPPVPASLSDFPGGAIGPGTREEALAAMNGQELLGAMENMTPEQIETYLNRQL